MYHLRGKTQKVFSRKCRLSFKVLKQLRMQMLDLSIAFDVQNCFEMM